MLVVSDGRFLNPQGAPQISESFAEPSAKFYNYKDW